jgi:hypothetical protein
MTLKTYKMSLKPGELQPETPLPWAVYNGNGRLLLEKGRVVTTRQIESLLEFNAYRVLSHVEEGDRKRTQDSNKSVQKSPFDVIERSIKQLGNTLESVL